MRSGNGCSVPSIRSLPAGGAAAMIARALTAEAVGTALLLAVIVGSGIMGERLSGGSIALALIGNTVATGAILVVLISIFGPVSGAHFNPAVTLVALRRREISASHAAAYVAAQFGGAMLGVLLAHAMFGEALIQVATTDRSGSALAFSEAIATFGLVLTILGGARYRPNAIPALVGLYVTAGYWFTASTSFANPAVTVARSLSDTFAGIAPAAVPGFVAAQLVGALAASTLAAWLFPSDKGPER